MEQRIGSSSKPLGTAAVDPAAIPGLTSPVPAEPEDGTPDPVKEAAPEETTSEATSETTSAAAPEVSDAVPEASEVPETSEAEAETPEADGPVFEASDRRAKIVADHSGVRLSLDDQACEFRWDEIGAVETETSRFGKRFTVTVHTPDRRWYPVEIEAKAKSQPQEWESELDAVLDKYFEDAEPEDAETEAAETEAVDEEDAEVSTP